MFFQLGSNARREDTVFHSAFPPPTVSERSIMPHAHCTVSQRTQKAWLTDGGGFQGRQSPSSVTVLKFAYGDLIG